MVDVEVSCRFERNADSFILSGTLNAPSGCRVALLISQHDLVEQPEGFILSESGFYFVYLFGNGNENSFEIRIPFHLVRQDSLNVRLRRWYSEGDILVRLNYGNVCSEVFIVGSCVSRDLFAGNSEQLLAGYRARTSFAAINCEPLFGLNNMSLSLNQSEFQRRMVLGDHQKDAVTAAANAPGHTVLVDFIDERFELFRAGDTYISNSPEFKKCLAGEIYLDRLDIFSEEYFRKFAINWARFVEVLENKKVVINKAFWATKDDQGMQISNEDLVSQENDKLMRLYEIVHSISREVEWLELEAATFIAKKDHRWGEAPFHYSENTVEAQKHELERILELDLSP